MATVWNLLIGAALLAMFVAGFALFWIARQDDSRTGRLFGLVVMAAAAMTLGYLGYGHHWL